MLVLGSVGMQIMSHYVAIMVLALTFAGGRGGLQILLLFTVPALTLGGNAGMQILLLVTVLALTFAGSGQPRHADFVTIDGTRPHFCWFLGNAGMQILLLFTVLDLIIAGSGQCRHADVVTLYGVRADFCWTRFWAR